MQRLTDEKVFKDPIHSFVRVTDLLIWQLIETPEFQRLRRIKQLGGTHIVYPTAEHSRFSHSLGVYFIARRMIDVLNKQKMTFNEIDRMLILCAALLHDVGHGPFSHSFESVLGVNHEDFTRRILLENTRINHLLEGYRLGFSKEVSDVIGKKHANRLIVSLISSEIDADRLDYLLRDSYFTGTPYGEIDLERLLRTMRVEQGKVVFKYSGMHALEDYLFSRYQMYWQVYLHDCSLSFNFLIQAMLFRVRTLLEAGHAFNCRMHLFEWLFLTDVVDIDAYLRMDDGVITTYAGFFLDEADVILQDLAHRFLNRGLLDEFDYVPTAKSEALYETLSKRLDTAGISATDYLFHVNHQRSTYDYYGLDGDEKIDLLMPDGDTQEISAVSNIIKGIVNAPKQKNTLFLPLKTIKENDNRVEIMDILEQLIGRKVDV
ncbi:MAG: HD domain-containing protein [Defluviitaleaceae bacterium]|nr:HD domain-containing protein [Defluviitaleaceae bacterium]